MKSLPLAVVALGVLNVSALSAVAWFSYQSYRSSVKFECRLEVLSDYMDRQHKNVENLGDSLRAVQAEIGVLSDAVDGLGRSVDLVESVLVRVTDDMPNLIDKTDEIIDALASIRRDNASSELDRAVDRLRKKADLP